MAKTARQALADAIAYLQDQHELNAAQKLELWVKKNVPPPAVTHKWEWVDRTTISDDKFCTHCGLQYRWGEMTEGGKRVGHWITACGERIKRSGGQMPKCTGGDL